MRSNVAFLFYGVGDLSGGGGAERFFWGFFLDYLESENKKNNLFFITDTASLKNLSHVRKIKSPKNIFVVKIFSNRFKLHLESMQLLWFIIVKRIRLVQLPLYSVHYYKTLKILERLPAFIRPKLTLTMVDSFVAHYYLDKEDKVYNYSKVYGSLFENVKLDAVISWYKLFREFDKKNCIIKSRPDIYTIDSRYTTKKFNLKVPKKNYIVYAGRLTQAKQPLMFVEAVSILKKKSADLRSWKFFIYGKGLLENEVRKMIKIQGLEEIIKVSHTYDLTEVFEESKCFVSTQDFENFPSLSMNEAMAAGNAIIARNVGQTCLFVKNNVNGILLKEDNAIGLAVALEYYISNPDIHEPMARESVRLTKEVHTFGNFKTQMEDFWKKIIKKK